MQCFLDTYHGPYFVGRPEIKQLTPSAQAKAFSALLSTLAEFDSKIGITKPETLLK